MKVFLAGCNSLKNCIKEYSIDYVLESFYTFKDWESFYINNSKMFLLDSGAFTFMNDYKGESINWDEYIEKYASFIIKNNIKYFFELDIDVLVGLKEVERLRDKLEKLVGRKCIPVWHKERGIDYWKKLTKEYSYVAIGGIVVGELTQKDYKNFIPMLEIAKRNLCNVHGLGFTPTKILSKYKFFSVDSTNWLSGARFGTLYYFNGKYIVSKTFKNKRAKGKIINFHNLKEWLKFQKYADKYL